MNELQRVTGRRYSGDQKEAMLHTGGPLWITAGPGSGKTEVLVGSALRLMLCEGVDPSSIILTTFTRRAAANLSHRIASYIEALGLSDSLDTSTLRTGTLHSICNEVLRDHRYLPFVDLELMDEEDRSFFLFEQQDILEVFRTNWQDLKELFSSRTPPRGPNKWAQVSAASFIFDRITEFRVDVAQMAKSENKKAKLLAAAYQLYRQRLTEKYRCDQSVLQEHFLRFLESRNGEEFLLGSRERERLPVSHILVDEYQDTNPIQEVIYFELARNQPHNLLVVGDDDQSLYRFRGGTVDSLVRFGANSKERWSLDPTRIDLHDNFRSHPEIVSAINEYIRGFPVMRRPGIRAPGKEKLEAKSGVAGAYPAVTVIEGHTLQEVADKVADFLQRLHSQHLITDWRDVGILLHSTKETRSAAGPYVDSLKSRDVKVYNPRNRALHKGSLITQLLGALTTTLDPNSVVLHGSYEGGRQILGRQVTIVKSWLKAYDTLASTREGRELARYVKGAQRAISRVRTDALLNTTVTDVLYRVLSFEPFRSAREDPGHAARIGLITSILDSFTTFREHRGVLRGTSRRQGGGLSTRFLTDYYYEFAGYIGNGGLNDPEDPDDLMPQGYVQVMTVHQAKGLEFPVVVAGNLDAAPRVGQDHWAETFLAKWSARQPVGAPIERAEQDLIRKFYVAFSRAKNLLVLPLLIGSDSRWGVGG